MELDAKIEAILFFKSEPIAVKKLSVLVGAKEGETRDALLVLEQNLTNRGVRLLRKDDEVMLGTAPEISALIEDLVREELSRDIGRAGLEALSIVLYRGPITRSQIDWIRGVNSTFILRNLLIRGLVEKVPNPADSRSFLYRPTFQLLSHLGVAKVEELPEYEKVLEEVTQSEESNKEEPDDA